WLFCVQRPCNGNIVRVFYSNAKFTHDGDGRIVTSITLYIMGEEVYNCHLPSPNISKYQMKGGEAQQEREYLPVKEVPILAPPPLPHITTFLDTINGLSMRVDAQLDALTNHVDARCTLLEEHMTTLMSNFPSAPDT
ncbi:hypothetical protein Goarm_000921, partial [Gossypium armourianum]|nr:hypothetical protein [Gossypium armourianum]